MDDHRAPAKMESSNPCQHNNYSERHRTLSDNRNGLRVPIETERNITVTVHPEKSLAQPYAHSTMALTRSTTASELLGERRTTALSAARKICVETSCYVLLALCSVFPDTSLCRRRPMNYYEVWLKRLISGPALSAAALH